MGIIYPVKQTEKVNKTFTQEEAKALVDAIDSGKSFIEVVGVLGNEANGDNISPHYNAIIEERNKLRGINASKYANEADYLNALSTSYIDKTKWYNGLLAESACKDFTELKAKIEAQNAKL